MIRILFSVILCLSFTSSLPGQEAIPSMRVIAYNIWNGFDWGKDTVRHRQFLEWAAFQRADVMALQELCGYTAAKLKEDALAWGHEHSVILKEEGYPVGITSKWPIEVIEKRREGMWHGFLHVRTAGIDFFVVHLSPADWQFRRREARLLAERIDQLTTNRYIILGDFNAHSPMDADLDRERLSLLARAKVSDANNNKHQNLRHGYWDYTVLSTFLASGLIDAGMPYMEPEERFSFPTPALTGIYQTASEIPRNRRRIDYILCSPVLSEQCVYSRILNGSETARLSDHYPVVADFVLK